jgi:prevent-host-death family protein
MTSVSTIEFRKHLSELMELAYYKNQQVRISRKGKPMARLVGEPFMQALGNMVNLIIKNDPSLADTLAIVADEEIREAILESQREYESGKKISIVEAFK